MIHEARPKQAMATYVDQRWRMISSSGAKDEHAEASLEGCGSAPPTSMAIFVRTVSAPSLQ